MHLKFLCASLGVHLDVLLECEVLLYGAPFTTTQVPLKADEEDPGA